MVMIKVVSDSKQANYRNAGPRGLPSAQTVPAVSLAWSVLPSALLVKIPSLFWKLSPFPRVGGGPGTILLCPI